LVYFLNLSKHPGATTLCAAPVPVHRDEQALTICSGSCITLFNPAAAKENKRQQRLKSKITSQTQYTIDPVR